MIRTNERQQAADLPTAMTVKHMCTDLDISLTTGWKLIRENKVKAVRIGRRTLVLRSSIEQLISQN